MIDIDKFTAIERLEGELNDLEYENARLKTELENIKNNEAWSWTVQYEIEAANDPLPIPRLEMVARPVSNDWRNMIWEQRIVYGHLLGHHVCVPIGNTKVGGGRDEEPTISDLPFRDGVHFGHNVKMWGWPAFVTIGGISKPYTPKD